LANEKIKSYVWMFKTFLKAMGGVPSHLIITDEDASMKAAIIKVLPDTTHNFACGISWTKYLRRSDHL
jgi:hypothetical protein